MLTDVCREIEGELRGRPEFAHTAHLLVMVDGRVIHDAHFRGPLQADVFSVTKSVVGTLAGIAVRQGLLRDLELPLERVLDVAGTPSEGQTLRQLLTMTRGSRTDGRFDIDEVMRLPRGWIARIAAAPRVAEPGTAFRYDNGSAHLFGAALSKLVGMPLSEYAARELFVPLKIQMWYWPKDPDGVDFGFGHLRLAATDLAKLGALWLGAWPQLMDEGFAGEMLTPRNPGGWPENRPYGYQIWLDEHGPFAGGWAGQHVTVVRRARAVVVTTGDPDGLRAGWRPARELVVERLIPALSQG